MHVARIFETFIKRRIQQQGVPAFHDRDHRLARARHVAAENDVNAVFEDQLLGERGKARGAGLGVVADDLQFAAVDAAGLVDFLHSQQRAHPLRILDDAT